MTRDPQPNDLTHQKTAKDMLADENFGPREIDELAKKFVLEDMNDEGLSKDELETVKEIALERNFYLDEGDKYSQLAHEVDSLLDTMEEAEMRERLEEILEDFTSRKSFVQELRENKQCYEIVIDEDETVSEMGAHGLMELGQKLANRFPRTEFSLKHGHDQGGANPHVSIYWTRGGR